MDNRGIEAVPYQADSYPEVLKNIEDAPVVLYMKGKYHPDDRFAIGMVGSRKHTAYGETVTQRIAGELSSSGFTVISGLARGIDTLSHKSSLAAGGRTIAVPGSNPDVCYPAENQGTGREDRILRLRDERVSSRYFAEQGKLSLKKHVDKRAFHGYPCFGGNRQQRLTDYSGLCP
jgi:hypothetical protein